MFKNKNILCLDYFNGDRNAQVKQMTINLNVKF